MRKEGAIFSLLILFIITAMLFGSLGYDPQTRLIPLLTGIVSVILGLTVFFSELLPPLQRVFEVDLFKRNAMFQKNTVPPRWPERRGFCIILFWMALFALLLIFLGFLIAIPVCVFVFTKWFGQRPWKLSLMVTAGTWLFIYGLFEVIMKFDLFEGILLGGII